MSSTDPVPYTFDDVGITPVYLKATLEDLARDQMATDERVGSLSRQVMITGAGAVLGLGAVFLSLRMIGKLVKGISGIGEALYTTQVYVGMIPPPDGVPGPVEAPAAETVPSQEKQADTVSVGEGYDPGPQTVPDHVRAMIEAEPVANLLDGEEL